MSARIIGQGAYLKDGELHIKQEVTGIIGNRWPSVAMPPKPDKVLQAPRITFAEAEPYQGPLTIESVLAARNRAESRMFAALTAALIADRKLQAAQKEIAELRAKVEEQEHWLKGETDWELQGFRGGR